MLLQVSLLLAGVLLLYVGAEGLVRGASSLALAYGLQPAVVGLTVVALGTSMPEFLVNVFAVGSGDPPLALGNIIGSNVSNIALILGCSALVLPLRITPQVLRREYPVMVGVMVLFYVCAWDGRIGAGDGLVMVGLLAGLCTVLLYNLRRSSLPALAADVGDIPAEDDGLSGSTRILFLLGGSAGLGLGAHLMVDSATTMARWMGIDSVVIGLSVVAIGTSLPELAASLVSAAKDEADLSVGNVLGSNVLNVLFVVGSISLAHPLDVDRRSLVVDFPVMIGFCAVLLPMVWPRYRITRLAGALLLTGFLGYLGVLFAPYL